DGLGDPVQNPIEILVELLMRHREDSEVIHKSWGLWKSGCLHTIKEQGTRYDTAVIDEPLFRELFREIRQSGVRGKVRVVRSDADIKGGNSYLGCWRCPRLWCWRVCGPRGRAQNANGQRTYARHGAKSAEQIELRRLVDSFHIKSDGNEGDAIN